MLRRCAIAMALQLAFGCNAALVRLEDRGLHDEVVQRAAERDRPARRGGARALASALVAIGNVERARDVLLGDFRRGGQIASLVQLADLERNLGRDGVAAVHYARVIEIDRTVLRGRRDVCALLNARAAAWVALGEGEAALDDLDATLRLCASRDDRLRRRAEVQLVEHLRAQRRPAICGPECDRRTAAELDAAISRARADGPAALRVLAARERLSLAADDVTALLMADLRGRAGAQLVDDDELRGWIGDSGPAAYAPGLRERPAPEGAYLRLRLERVFDRSPDGGATSPTQRIVWLDRASVVEGAVRWRLLAYAGDLTAAEQDLVARWRPTAASEPAAAVPREPDVVRPTGRHWSLRVRVTETNLPELLVLARLRDAADDRDLALELRRHLLGAAEQARLAGVSETLREEVAHALGWGRPWLALALADTTTSSDIEPLRRAAATGVLLGETLCEGPCDEDRADLESIARVLGDAWIEQQRAALRDRALGRAQPRSPAGACPGLEEVLAPGAASPLAKALSRAREPGNVGVPRALVTAIESDPTLVCGARFALPLLFDREAGVSAARLSDALTHGTQLAVAEALTLHAALALLGQQPPRAENLGIAAAAAAADPRTTWRALARFARRTATRDVEVLALRELVLHAGRFEDDAVRRELVAYTVVDGARSWGARDTPAGRESVTYVVEEHLARLPASRRWAEREAVFAAIARHGLDAALLAVVQRILLPADRLAELGIATDGAEVQDGAVPRSTDAAASWSPRRMARAVTGRSLADAPTTARVFADVQRTAPLRLALAEHARDWGVRRRAAVGLAVHGSERDRAAAVAQLLAMTSAKSRAPLERLLLERPAAIADDAEPSTSVVPNDTVLLHVLFGLAPDDALWLGPAATEGP